MGAGISLRVGDHGDGGVKQLTGVGVLEADIVGTKSVVYHGG